MCLAVAIGVETGVESAPKHIRQQRNSGTPSGPKPRQGGVRHLMDEPHKSSDWNRIKDYVPEKDRETHAIHLQAPVLDLSAVARFPHNRSEFVRLSAASATPSDALTLEDAIDDADLFIDAEDLRKAFHAVAGETSGVGGEKEPLVYLALGDLRTLPRVHGLAEPEMRRLRKFLARCPI